MLILNALQIFSVIFIINLLIKFPVDKRLPEYAQKLRWSGPDGKKKMDYIKQLRFKSYVIIVILGFLETISFLSVILLAILWCFGIK